MLIAFQILFEQNCLPNSHYVSPILVRIVSYYAVMVVFFISKTSLQVKAAIAIRKNKN